MKTLQKISLFLTFAWYVFLFKVFFFCLEEMFMLVGDLVFLWKETIKKTSKHTPLAKGHVEI